MSTPCSENAPRITRFPPRSTSPANIRPKRAVVEGQSSRRVGERIFHRNSHTVRDLSISGNRPEMLRPIRGLPGFIDRIQRYRRKMVRSAARQPGRTPGVADSRPCRHERPGKLLSVCAVWHLLATVSPARPAARQRFVPLFSSNLFPDEERSRNRHSDLSSTGCNSSTVRLGSVSRRDLDPPESSLCLGSGNQETSPLPGSLDQGRAFHRPCPYSSS